MKKYMQCIDPKQKINENISKLSEYINESMANQLTNDLLSMKQKNSISHSLMKLISEEECWDKKNDPELMNEFMSSQKKTDIFLHHEELINLSFGDVEPFNIFSLNSKFVDELAKHFLSVDSKKFSDLHNSPSDLLYISSLNKNTINKLDKNLIFFDVKMNALMKALHKTIRSKISSYVKSPFAIVNTRAWLSKPNSNNHGPNAIHRDGFHSGHLKVMLYLTPLSKDFGELWIDGILITNRPLGTYVAFRNSDLRHSGILGEKYPRLCIEITLFRTFIHCDQFHHGHLNGRHYLNVGTPYLASKGFT